MNISITLQKKIIDFLLSLPTMHDSESQRAFIYHAGLDPQLQAQIPLGKPLAQFVPLFVASLVDYGTLKDGRHAIAAVLETTKKYVGQDHHIHCDALLKELRTDDTRVDIEAHPPHGRKISESSPGPRDISDSPIRVFISYAREDAHIAQRLYSDLEQAGVVPWLDTENLLPGQNWRTAIEQAINMSTYVLALLSSNSITKDGFIQKELKIALDLLDEVSETKIFVIPVRLDDCTPHDNRLQDLHWADLFPSYRAGLHKVLTAILPQQEPHDVLKKKVLLQHIDIYFFEGVWLNRLSNTRFYARVVDGRLWVTYCFGGELWQQAHYPEVRLKDNILYYRYEWFNKLHAGCGFYRAETEDKLLGGWWYEKDVPPEAISDITTIHDSLGHMVKSVLEREKPSWLPYWVEQYFQHKLTISHGVLSPNG
jgi:hypothetical protein